MNYQALATASLEKRAQAFEDRKSVLANSNLSDTEKRTRVDALDADMAAYEVEARGYIETEDREKAIRSSRGLTPYGSEADVQRAKNNGGSGHVDESRKWLPNLTEYRAMQQEQRAVGTSGSFIPTEYAEVYVDLIRKRTSVLAAGPVQIDVFGAHSVKIPIVASPITVGSRQRQPRSPRLTRGCPA